MNGSTYRMLLAALATVAFTTVSLAHDNWISKGGFRGPQNGEWCCGANDCFVVPASAVKPNGAGFEIAPTQETIPYSEVLPSIDNQYWRCHRPDGTRRCFFAPTLSF